MPENAYRESWIQDDGVLESMERIIEKFEPSYGDKISFKEAKEKLNKQVEEERLLNILEREKEARRYENQDERWMVGRARIFKGIWLGLSYKGIFGTKERAIDECEEDETFDGGRNADFILPLKLDWDTIEFLAKFDYETLRKRVEFPKWRPYAEHS